MPFGKLHVYFLKHIAGVKKATNAAVIGELGRFPLFLMLLLVWLNTCKD
jgi:hypothetical protein